MILEPGSKVLIVHRRLFDKDKGRFFIGVVEQCEGTIAKVTGYTWIQDQFHGTFLKKPDPRTKIVSLASQGLILYALPPTIDLADLKFDYTQQGQVWLHDAANRFKMDLSEGYHAA